MPFVDVLLNRLARGEAALEHGAPGDPVPLPDMVTEVRRGEREWRVEGGGLFQPPEAGVYYLRSGRDTIGAISVNPDPRESRLARASDAQARQLWKGARMVALQDAADASFSSASRGDLRSPLLWLALIAGLAEVGLASGWRRRLGGGERGTRRAAPALAWRALGERSALDGLGLESEEAAPREARDRRRAVCVGEPGRGDPGWAVDIRVGKERALARAERRASRTTSRREERGHLASRPR